VKAQETKREAEKRCYSTPSCLEFNQPETHSQAIFPKFVAEILSGAAAANNCGTAAKRLHRVGQGGPEPRGGRSLGCDC
jgi:hypothetical protein